jgi:hypothetical protein
LSVLPSQIQVTQIPLGEHCCRVKSFNSQDPNSSVTNYYQSGPISIKSLCIVELLMVNILVWNMVTFILNLEQESLWKDGRGWGFFICWLVDIEMLEDKGLSWNRQVLCVECHLCCSWLFTGIVSRLTTYCYEWCA